LKKNYLKNLIFFGGFILSNIAFAKINMNVQSSEKLYLCNAGLIHPAGENFCQEPSTGRSCDPTSTDSVVCVCTSSSPLGDFISGTVIQPTFRKYQQIPSAASNYMSLADESMVFQTELQDVEVNLGSEQFGAKYYMQFCYHGPVVNNSNNFAASKADLSEGLYKAALSLSALNKIYNSKILNSAQLTTECDLRKVGAVTGPREEGSLPNDFSFEVDFSNQGQVSINDGTLGIGKELILNLNSNASQVPRYCKLTLLFSEAPTGMRNVKSRVDFSGVLNIAK
jgi:hypothetical protein